jgi:hypothetical protein
MNKVTVQVLEHPSGTAYDCHIFVGGGVPIYESVVSVGHNTPEEAWQFFADLGQAIETGLFPGD